MRFHDFFYDSDESGNVQHQIVIFDQPVTNWVMAQVYEWYCMRAWPIVKRLERVECWLSGDDEDLMPLGARQDCRAYDLSRKNRKDLAFIDITPTQLQAIGQ